MPAEPDKEFQLGFDPNLGAHPAGNPMPVSFFYTMENPLNSDPPWG